MTQTAATSASRSPSRARPIIPRPIILCILDGWGYRPAREDNAIALARTPTWTHLVRDFPTSFLETSGLQVGLPDGQMGNSEVGHMNLGAGRVVMQDLPRVDLAVADGSLATNERLNDVLAKVKASGGVLHLLGLLSPGGVHSHQDHIVALARIASNAGVAVKIHAFLDGRDTPPSSALEFLGKFESDIAALNAKIVTVGGRYYAMDRDKRWDRVQLAYAAMVSGQGIPAASARAAVEASYANGKTDEFVLPAIIGDYAGIEDGDGLLIANYRSDRVREISQALVDPAFDGFPRGKVAVFAAKASMTEYSSALAPLLPPLFPVQQLTNILGQVVSQAGLKQLRIAETEKYAHVTFFFNGGEEAVYPGEDRILVASPKVATYDLQPAMSAGEVTDKLVGAIESGRYDLIVANYANGDMVGHTGILSAAIEAVETIDGCLKRLEAAIVKAGGTLLITADHGNAELMRDPETGQPHTAHTIGVVPLVLVNGPAAIHGLAKGRLADVAPTLLALLGLPQPAEMTGHSLLQETAEQPVSNADHRVAV